MLLSGQTTCPPIFSPGPCAPPPSTPPTPPPPPDPPTKDKEVSEEPTAPTKYIPLCPDCNPNNPPGGSYTGGGGGGNIPSCVFENIQNTGNDIQVIKNSNLVAQAMVWDSDCPAFSLIVSENPNTQNPLNAAFVVELNGSNDGTITDPDIIIGQQDVANNEIAIFIVYEYTSNATGITEIAYEQWNYNYDPGIRYIELASPGGNLLNVISSGIQASNPNVDANNKNQLAIAFEVDGDIISYVDHIVSSTVLNISDIIDISHCIGASDMMTPDVSISDESGYNSVVSYVFNHGPDMYVVQDEFLGIHGQSQAPCSQINHLSSDYINPRISSPADFDIFNLWECAVAAVDVNYRTIAVFHNYLGPTNFSMELLNSEPNSLQLLMNCNNTMPAITFTGGEAQDMHSVAVSWTYDDCTGLMLGNQEVFAVNLYLENNSRVPYHPDYFMPVNLSMSGEQYASSIAGEGNYIPGERGNVFYSLASQAPNKIIYKMSNVFNQPLLRKKIDNNEKQKNQLVNIFPNPSKGKIIIDLSFYDENEPMEILVFGMDGKKVFQDIIFSKTNTKEIDLSVFGPGIYFINIKAGGFTAHEKIVIEQ